MASMPCSAQSSFQCINILVQHSALPQFPSLFPVQVVEGGVRSVEETRHIKMGRIYCLYGWASPDYVFLALQILYFLRLQMAAGFKYVLMHPEGIPYIQTHELNEHAKTNGPCFFQICSSRGKVSIKFVEWCSLIHFITNGA